jgi:hypothetical protein
MASTTQLKEARVVIYSHPDVQRTAHPTMTPEQEGRAGIVREPVRKKYFALVIGEHHIEHHKGENGEPLLTLVIFRPPIHPGTFEQVKLLGSGRMSDLCPILTDVPHESHKFTDAQIEELRKQGIVYPGNYLGAARWREVTLADFPGIKTGGIDLGKGSAPIQ